MGVSGPSLHIESADSMIGYSNAKQGNCGIFVCQVHVWRLCAQLNVMLFNSMQST